MKTLHHDLKLALDVALPPVIEGSVTVYMDVDEEKATDGQSANELAKLLLEKGLIQLPDGVAELTGWEFEGPNPYLPGEFPLQPYCNGFRVAIFPTGVKLT